MPRQRETHCYAGHEKTKDNVRVREITRKGKTYTVEECIKCVSYRQQHRRRRMRRR